MLRSILALGLVAALCSVPAAAQGGGRTVITHEKLWGMKRLGTPEASPDGRWVVIAVTEPSYEPDKSVSDLWLIPADGSGPGRRLTFTRAAESDTVWAPDSRSIAFSTQREGDEVAQIYVLPIEGVGEAQRVTASATAAVNPRFRPDGAAILYETSIYPGAADAAANRKAAEARRARKYAMRAYQSFPIRYWDRWLDERRQSLVIQPLAPGAPPRDLLATTALGRAPGFGAPGEGESTYSLGAVWSPDGREVLFVATRDRGAAAYANVGFDIYRVGVDGGEPRKVTKASATYNGLQFTPDGSALLFRSAAQNGEVYNLPRLTRIDWGRAPGQATLLSPGFDREPLRFGVTPDSRTVYMIVPEGEKQSVYRVPVRGGTPERLIEPKTGAYVALSVPGKAPRPVVIGSWGSAVSPNEVVRIDPATRTHAPLTAFNTAVAATIDWAPPQSFRFTSKRGREINNLVVLPPNFDRRKKYPLLVMIHGGPASSNLDQISLRWNYHLLTAPGYVLLMTDYVGSTGYGERFAQGIKGDPLKGPGEEIEEAVDEAARRFPYIDASNACATGASYGGHLTNWLQATSTRYKCLISHAGEVNLVTQWGTSDFSYGREVANGGPPWDAANPIWREQSPSTYAERWKTPMLVTIGERDYRVPLSNSLENWAILQRQKVPSRLLVFPDAGHWILKPEDSRQFYKEVHAWLARYLKGGPALPDGPVE
jgi:dipeptidyl aminopeptidase/acylaminoacyl peptidase